MDRPSGSSMEMVTEPFTWLQASVKPLNGQGRPQSEAACPITKHWNGTETGRPHSAAAERLQRWDYDHFTVVVQRLETGLALQHMSSKKAEFGKGVLDGSSGRTYKPMPLKRAVAPSPPYSADQRVVAGALDGNGLGKRRLQPWYEWATALSGGAQIICPAQAAPGSTSSTESSSKPTMESTAPQQAGAKSGRKAVNKPLTKQQSSRMSLRTVRGPTRTPTPTNGTPTRKSSKSSMKPDSQRDRIQVQRRTHATIVAEANGQSVSVQDASGEGSLKKTIESPSPSSSSPTAAARTRRRRAATSREPHKTIGTIEWARSTANAIAAASPVRRHSPSTSRGPSRSASPEKPAAKEQGSPPREGSAASGGTQMSPDATSDRIAAGGRAGEVELPAADHENASPGLLDADSQHDSAQRQKTGMAQPEVQSRDDGEAGEEGEIFIEELTDPVPPLSQLIGGKALLLLRDFSSRVVGNEGKALAVEVEEREPNDSSAMPMARLVGSQRKAKIGFDSISHTLLPWPVPIDHAVERLTSTGKMASSQLAADLRRTITPGLSQYAVGQELVALIDGIWLDARVLQPPDCGSSTVHKVQGGGSAHHVLLHPWNHAPLIMRCSPFNEVCNRHFSALLSKHTFIIDALSGQQLHVHHQCVPLDLAPVEEGKGPVQVTDVGELYNWLYAAQALRRDIPSTLAKAAKFSSYGQPDEAADRVSAELADRLLAVTGTPAELAAARAAIQRAQTEVDQAKLAYGSSADQLLHQQKLDLEDHLAAEKSQEEQHAARQLKEQETNAEDQQNEMANRLAAHKEESKDLHKEHQRVTAESHAQELAVKREFEQSADKALKAFKDAQFKEADTFKRKLAGLRVEGDSRLATYSRQEHEEFLERRSRQYKTLEAKHEDEKSRIDDDLVSEAKARVQSFEDRKQELDVAQAASVIALAEAQAAELIAAEAANKEALKTLARDQKKLAAEQEVMHKQQVFDTSNDDSKTKMQQAQLEERNQMAIRHKDDVKKFNTQCEARRTALVSKQEEDRKAMFAMRRQTVAAAEKKGESVKAQQAQWAEEDRKNKSLPKKEAEMLEAQIGKDKADFIAKQESEGEQLLNKQADHFEALKLRMQQDNKDMAQRQSAEQAKLASQHEQNLTLLREQNAAEMVSMQERHEKAKVDHVRKQASEQETLQTEKKADADNAGIRNEEFRKDMATRHTKETEQNVLQLDREKKQLDQRQEERRKQHAAELEEELTRFSARQEEERNAFMSKQKANEKKLVESQIAQSDEMESNHAEEKVNAEGRQRGEISDLEAKQHRLQTKLDSRHASQRSALASEQQKAKAQFLLKQQTDRDRHAAKHRDILSRVIEHTQNEVNHALLNKAGFLLTAPPAAGKTCAVSQLMMTALNDKKPGGFVPIAIKVQQLQNRLHADRHEIDRRLKEERDLYYGDEHIGFDLYTLRDLMRRLSNGKKRIKDYFEQWDTDKNGTVDRAEFGEAVRSLGGRNASEDEIQAAFDQLDLDHSGEIDYDEMHDHLFSLPRDRPGTKPPMPPLSDDQLRKVYGPSAFANAWNWVDSFLRLEHGVQSDVYLMQRQALISRRALIILDGIDEGGAVRDEIERHIVEVLAKQGHTVVVTSRLEGLNVELFAEAFEHLTLKPLSDSQQQELIEKRLSGKEKGNFKTNENGRDEELLRYLRTRVPLDTETGTRMTGNPLMLSMIVTLFENLDGEAMPETLSALYSRASASMLSRTGSSAEGATDFVVPAVPHLESLLEAIFFRAHVAQRRLIEEQHIEAAALELGAPEELAAIDWPVYKGRSRVGHVVKLLRGDNAGERGVLSADARGTYINGKEPKNPLKVRFSDGKSSGWVKETDVETSGLDKSSFDTLFAGDGRHKAMRTAIENLPEDLQRAMHTVRSRVAQDQLPLLVMLQEDPMLMQSAHLSFQEFYCARALHKGMALPCEPPWKWSAWWANCLRLGVELGEGFGRGLVRASAVKNGTLDLPGEVGGHRPTSLAAIAELMQGVHTLDLSGNNLNPNEVAVIANAIARSKTLTSLNLGKNAIGDEGAKAVAAVMRQSKLVNLSLFNTNLGLAGAKALAGAIQDFAPSLKKLNLQYNALRGDSKKVLEQANAARTSSLFLII